MKEYTLIPQLCTDHTKEVEGKEVEVKAAFDGCVKVRVPTYKERMEFRAMAVNVIAMEEGKLKTLEGLNQVVAMVEKSKDFYVVVDLKFKEDGTVFKSFDDLQMDPRCEEILQEIANHLARGIVPSKN
jgi:hypothetical protein